MHSSLTPTAAVPTSTDAPAPDVLAATVLLQTLFDHGVEYFFCNPGTDFPAIVEAYSLAEAAGEIGVRVPAPVVVPHENAAVAMAHGAYLASGRPQAVMVHVSVGTANTVNGAANAGRDQAPILIMAGRSPITEAGLHGSRNRPIHWAQEMYDQGGMLREFVKWDFELRMASETADTVARAMEVMMTSPRGPAYLSLPREVLSQPVPAGRARVAPKLVAAAPWPHPEAIGSLAAWVAAADRPLVVASASGRTREGFEALADVAERFALPVVTLAGRYACLPHSHPMHFGYQVKPLLQEADLVIVLDCDVPWLPALESPPEGCRVVHIASDPAFARYPTRGFPSHLAITADPVPALAALRTALDDQAVHDSPAVMRRRDRLAARRDVLRNTWQSQGDAAAADADHIRPEWISRCIHEAVGTDAVIVNEYPLRLEHCPRDRPGTFYGLSPAGGLGWGLGAAIGMKRLRPDATVVVTLGDGAYMFDNPTACHWVSAVQQLPVLVVVFNNQLYGAVRNSTASMYADGASAGNSCTLLADLSPSPAFEMIAQANGAYGERVDDPAALPAALQRALHAVRAEGRQALLNVVCRY
ncbi:thiamine pyrophosphate-requiring protein [uncultured Xylophilus sp.]|uniref:thiamine pyrophosphate-requiring protein n=1 Tax=uncultured Xylophilus sp. TaxID=296832 RepID=UPI0025CBE940|nr:thiamine pyrophosphate-requiring protein [uncultured Xylophilus sp.]